MKNDLYTEEEIKTALHVLFYLSGEWYFYDDPRKAESKETVKSLSKNIFKTIKQIRRSKK